MKSFAPGFIERHSISQNLLRTVRQISEYKGKQDLFKEQSPQVFICPFHDHDHHIADHNHGHNHVHLTSPGSQSNSSNYQVFVPAVFFISLPG